MKKLFYLFLIIGLAVISCNKPATLPPEQEVIFKAATFETGFKTADICNHDVANYAKLTIQLTGDPGTAIEKIVDIFYLNNIMYTNTLKLAPGDYQVTSFMLMNDGDDNLSETEDDVIVYATPDDGSPYALLVDGLPIDFTVGAFMKNEVNLEVICYEPADYDKFGFSWFAIDFTTVPNRDMFFFGDLCTKYFEDYANSPLYNVQDLGNGLSHDLIAIFKIQVLKQKPDLTYEEVGLYTNETTSMSGVPLIVPHPDDPNVSGEKFKFKLWILVKNGTGFSYKKFHVWTITDDAIIPSGDDNVIDFVLGSCVPSADLVLPPYMNLPDQATVQLIFPGSTSYWNLVLSGIGLGYDISNTPSGQYVAGFCGDLYNTIGGTKLLNVRSSLYLDEIPDAFNVQKPVLGNINWLANNLYRYPGHSWVDIQNAVWMIIGQKSETSNAGGIGIPSAIAIAMKNDANANGIGYVPSVGGYAAVLFISPYANATYRYLQLIFTLVDP